MQTVNTIIHARYLIPIVPHNTYFENYSIVIHQGKIIDVLANADCQKQYQSEQVVSLDHHIVLPGLINAHAHTPMNLLRGLADDLPLMQWLNDYIWPKEKAWINANSVELGSQLAIAEMLRGGTTCFSDHYFFPDSTAKAVDALGIRAVLGHVVINVPTQWADTETGYIERARDILEQTSQHDRLYWTVAPHAPYTVSDDGFKQVKQLSEQYQLPIHIHLHETATEITGSEQQYGMRPLARLQQLGILNEKFIGVHATQLTNDEITLLQQQACHIVHCPESNLKLASGFAPTSSLLEEGVNVALGTDGAASNNDLDMLGEMRSAALLAKGVQADPTVLPAAEVLKMATLNGAKALGLADEIGSLEKNKWADIIALDINTVMSQPLHNPISHMVYASSRDQVSDVWVAGKQLLADKHWVDFDEQALLNETEQFTRSNK